MTQKFAIGLLRFFLFFGSLLAPLTATAGIELLRDDPPLFPISEIQSGMQAKGYSVFSSVKGPEEFSVEILGLMENFPAPKHRLIIVRILGDRFAGGSVPAGMSGSPVFVGSKLLGAVGYGFGSFVKEPIAGITPIEDMLQTRSSVVALSTLTDASIKPLSVPLAVSGVSPAAIQAFAPLFASRGYALFAPSAGLVKNSKAPVTRFQAGDPIAALMVSGDMTMAAVGTVTWVRGNEFVGFGHALGQAGEMDVPAATADIVTTVFSQAGAYKLGQARNVIGAFRNDRISGQAGVTNQRSSVLPLLVKKGDKQWKYGISYHPTDLSMFASLAFASSLQGQNERELGGTMELNTQIKLSDGQTMNLEHQFAGEAMALEQQAAMQLMADLEAINSQALKKIKISALQLTVRQSREVRLAKILSLETDNELKPGQEIKGHFQLQRWRKDPLRIEFNAIVPKGLAGGDYQLMIADRAAAIQLEKDAGLSWDPQTFTAFLTQLKSLPQENEVCFYLVKPDTSKRLSGYPLGGLPGSLSKILSTTLVNPDSIFNKSAVRLKCMKLPNVTVGSALGDVHIRLE